MGSSSSMSSQEDEVKDDEQTESNEDNATQESYSEDTPEECILEAKVRKSKDQNNNEKGENKKRKSVMVADQSIDVQDFIIAIKVDENNYRGDDFQKFEIPDMSPNEILQQKEEEKRKVELEKLTIAKRKREEEIYKEERLISLYNQLDARYSILEKYGDDKMEVSQTVIDNLSSLVKNFHNRKKCERYIPTLAKRQPALEKKLRRRKQEKENLQKKHIKVTPTRLKQTNPDIAELSSPTRAKKLATQLSALYDQERKACFMEVRQRAPRDIPDSSIHICLRDLFLFCYKRCQAMADTQNKSIMSSLRLTEPQFYHIVTNNKDTTYVDKINALSCSLLTKEFQKNVSRWCLARLKKESLLEISQIQAFDLVTKTLRAPPYRPPLNHYLDCSNEISWLLLLHNPSLSILYNREPKFNEMYRPISTEGSNISYVIWPALTETDSVLVKGVAMFDKKTSSSDTPQNGPRILSA